MSVVPRHGRRVHTPSRPRHRAAQARVTGGARPLVALALVGATVAVTATGPSPATLPATAARAAFPADVEPLPSSAPAATGPDVAPQQPAPPVTAPAVTSSVETSAARRPPVEPSSGEPPVEPPLEAAPTGAPPVTTEVAADPAEPSSSPLAPAEAAAATEPIAVCYVTPSDRRLTWAPPALTDPTTVPVSASSTVLTLDPARDYVVAMPASPVVAVGGVRIVGGRNVVLIGGEIAVPAGAPATNHGNRGLYLTGQTGTVHVEGLRITGAGLGEGINLDQRLGAVVQLQNVVVDTVHGSASGHHADVLQTWAGPRILRIDGLRGTTEYQGLMLLPMQFGTQPQPELFDLRRVDIRGEASSAYLIWRDSLPWPLSLSGVWLSPRRPTLPTSEFLWPKGTGTGTAAWPSVTIGAPAEPVVTGAGVGYVSPGYQ